MARMIRMKYKPLPPTPSKYMWYWEPFEWEEEEVRKMRLIDADSLIHEMEKGRTEALATAVTVSFDKPGEGLLCGLNMAEKIYATAMLAVYSAPTIDPVKTGKWNPIGKVGDVYDFGGYESWGMEYRCSKCGFIHTAVENHGVYQYCPHCGAHMERSEE